MLELMLVTVQLIAVWVLSYGWSNGAPWWFDTTGMITVISLADLIGSAP